MIKQARLSPQESFGGMSVEQKLKLAKNRSLTLSKKRIMAYFDSLTLKQLLGVHEALVSLGKLPDKSGIETTGLVIAEIDSLSWAKLRNAYRECCKVIPDTLPD